MVKYERNYLTEVSMKIEFEKDPRIIEEDCIKVFKEIFAEEFASTGFEKSIFKNGQFYNNLWVFQKRDKEINLRDSSLELIYDIGAIPKDFNEVINDVTLIREALIENCIGETKYMGLRYINEINPSIKVEDWNEWINPDLVNLNFKTENSKLIRGMSKYEYEIDNFNINFQFGQYNINYPSPIIHDNFILDYEVYINYEETMYLKKHAREMHEIITEFFEKSIGDKLRENMGIIE
ncbi:MAG: TIGR04255 family protein [Methanobrevibacter sp.]|nr:TIGR04255 family protein [Methanobrevibacter sp.]